MKTKKAMTLIELMVSMAIFSAVLLVAVGAFISINNLRAVALSARESQQKLRMAIEMISRYSRQADKVITGGSCDANKNCSEAMMFFNLADATSRYGVKFSISPTGYPDQLHYYECIPSSPTDECSSSWGTGKNLLGNDVVLVTGSGFQKNADVVLRETASPLTTSQKNIANPPTLSIKLNGSMPNGNSFYQNDFDIDTRVIMESIK